jgi:hypothetical protein
LEENLDDSPEKWAHVSTLRRIFKMQMGEGRGLHMRPKQRDKEGPTADFETEVDGDFLAWFVGLVVPVQNIFVLPWLL